MKNHLFTIYELYKISKNKKLILIKYIKIYGLKIHNIIDFSSQFNKSIVNSKIKYLELELCIEDAIDAIEKYIFVKN